MSTNSSNLRLKKLAAGLSTAFALIGMGSSAFASVLTVTSCADTNAAGTLRTLAAASANGDQIDLSQLSCPGNTLTLSQGEIVFAHTVSLVGPANAALTIAGDGAHRVLNSTSIDKPVSSLTLLNLHIAGGAVNTDSDDAQGGCILATSDLTLSNSTVSGCTASSVSGAARGGAIYAQNVTLQSSRVSGNVAYAGGAYQSSRGGGVHAYSLSCTDSSLSENLAAASYVWSGQGGGALILGGDADLTRCTVDGNEAGQGAGMMQFVFGSFSSNTIIKNSTISGNMGDGGDGGMGVFCADCTPNPVQVLNSTIAFNTAQPGYAAGLSSNGAVIAQSSIFAKNDNSADGHRRIDADLVATSVSGSNNLVMSTSTPHGAGVITSSADPQLQALANNGGFTQTHALSNTSPARNQGNNTAGLATDQRGPGFSRTISGMADMGAYQHQN